MANFLSRLFSQSQPEERGFIDTALSNHMSGVNVTPETALTFSAVYAAIRVISETIAQLPLDYYIKTEKGREKYTASPLFKLVNSEPNKIMSKYTFFETYINTLLLYGNAYAHIVRKNNLPVGLVLIHPDDVQIEIKDGYKVFNVKDKGTIAADDMLHLLDMSFDGLQGQSRISKAMDNIALGIAAQKYGKEFFESGAKISGVLMHPGTIGSNALKTLKASWRKTFHAGIGSKFETAILEEGMQYKPIQLRPDEAQFLATRKFSILEISRIFRVPPHLLGDLERATFSNIEHQSIEFVIHTINPVAVKLEQELNKKLIPEADKGNTYFEHNNNQLLRGDAKARAEYYAKLFQVGAITPNEIRRRENMNDVDNGDSLYVPMNYININDKNPKADEKGNKTA
jgi:HK97 family phage portal protein